MPGSKKKNMRERNGSIGFKIQISSDSLFAALKFLKKKNTYDDIN